MAIFGRKEEKIKKRKEICDCILRGESYVNRLDKRWELGALAFFFLSLIILIFIFAMVGNTDGLFYLFFAGGLMAFFVALLLPLIQFLKFSGIKKIFEMELDGLGYEEDKKEEMLPSCLGLYFAPVPRQIMSLGVIPIIFAIVGIILSVEYRIPELPLFKINMLILLIILGAITEAIAFFFGFWLPEPELYKSLIEERQEQEKEKIKVDIDSEALVDALSKLKLETGFKKD